MGSLEEFLAIQNRNYEGIRGRQALVAKDGIIADTSVATLRGGITIALHHPLSVADAFARMSTAVSGFVPSIAYDAAAVHTTLVVGGTDFKVPFSFDLYNPDDARVVDILTRACAQVEHEFDRSYVEIDYPRYLYSNEVVVAEGYPKNAAFVELINQLVLHCQAEGLAVKGAWGAHCTVSRFLAARSAKDVRGLVRFVDEAKGPGVSRAMQFAVGYSHFDSADGRDGRFKPLQTFALGKH